MIDIEADGPIPGVVDYSMISLGAVVVEPGLGRQFYGQFRPISPKWVPEALAISKLTREETMAFPLAEETTHQFLNWLNGLKERKAERLMFVSDNNGFDWQFTNYYLHHFTGGNPMGHSSMNLGSLYKGIQRDMKANFKHLRSNRHTHDALDDAKGNAGAMLLILDKYGMRAKPDQSQQPFRRPFQRL